MSQFLFYYQRPEPATWVYMSSFVIVALFFMFHRLWSVRNLDIALIILLTPGLMLVYEGRKANALAANAASVANSQEISNMQTTNLTPPSSSQSNKKHENNWTGNQLQLWGFIWLLSTCGLWLIRLLLDTAMVRRPLLEPNLTSGGITFIGVSLFLFLMANVLTSPPIQQAKLGGRLGPGYELLRMLPDIQTSPSPATESRPNQSENGEKTTKTVVDDVSTWLGLSRALLILANLVLVMGIVAIGYWHFENLKTGIGIATLFMLLPYTAQMTGRLDHLAPAALIVLAVAFYRWPMVAGIMLGGAGGLVFYPFFLLPLWLSFYWLRGRHRFFAGFGLSIVLMISGLALATEEGFWAKLRQMFGMVIFATQNLDGVWGLGWHPYFRIPVMVVVVVLCLSFVFWPAQKSLATLMSCSAAIMVASQFCYAYGGGLYMAWFLPCTLLTVFRPNLDDCIALDVVRPWDRNKLKSKVSEDSHSKAYAEAG